jgi:hypothetical protein
MKDKLDTVLSVAILLAALVSMYVVFSDSLPVAG